MRSFDRRLERHVQETIALAQIAQQLDLTPIAVDLVEAHGKVEGIRLAVLGCPR